MPTETHAHKAQWFKTREGWYYAACTCGWRSLAFPDKDTAWRVLRAHEASPNADA